ncbi:MAG: hypothetical protein A2268_14955 [Candidatus Raymondbacteria bacterium RifOxyA12_full_50_37]|nr:MAG: hypothetical protein A2268_14955 [Candidatus Raymondbacteria bacterium RifOxyA12_full_50_37]OGJ88541.1 MAG: hypothetical protein A2248_20305 [Candidatus Raymondbacteria bacterium RIFOXYA2_FULL_49_16]OGJ99002.1 MAG: hypothetical protein A2453_11025 [Candidatus Raymondbacteria bacterium RIFOXYC2_FULL_50_21]OGK00638.1 MAG: hypothetical protein A2487_13870 [Candidatus Raymondbacteria bacterium RifOxyC12_full_50_8]OGP41512.1 MAG: hypothetical protein A2324_05835 [Candidatus Raymondbacteria b
MNALDENTKETLYRKWRRLGWDVDAEAYDGHVDPEETIVETTHAGRHDDRLFEWLLTFTRNYWDLINIKKVLRLLDRADKPVLGAVFDIAMAHGATRNFRTITEKCGPYVKPQILFHKMGAFEGLRAQEIKNGLETYKKWGLYCTMMDFYEDAALRRREVLQKNPLLALRALLGSNIRAEILFFLEQQTGMAIQALARNIGYAYSAVYNEVLAMVKNGLVVEKPGRGHILSLSEHIRQLLKVLPA